MNCFSRVYAIQGLFWLAAGSAAPGDGPSGPITIVVDLVVEDAKGRPVSDLKAGEIVVVPRAASGWGRPRRERACRGA